MDGGEVVVCPGGHQPVGGEERDLGLFSRPTLHVPAASVPVSTNVTANFNSRHASRRGRKPPEEDAVGPESPFPGGNESQKKKTMLAHRQKG